eukprot:TRINITY_DN10249_c0_g1_i3.p2 TRINITY_DN10249_c0_g1~~TRINITY_DN10249_c0_g1_i3.p2  ORF type:complete len:176 (-),score=80.79 TRINITY_DN10249_c0_g1_i3:24-551(-)
MLAKLVSEIDTIKEYVSANKAAADLDEFVEMENFDSEGEEDKVAGKVNRLKRMREEVGELRREIRSEQEAVQNRKERWKKEFNYLKSNYTSDMENRKQKMIKEKAEIDSIIKVLNRKVEVYKTKEKKVKELESELEPYLNEGEEKNASMEEKLSLIHICRCRRIERCRSRWSPYH